jgi:hypothetical protein
MTNILNCPNCGATIFLSSNICSYCSTQLIFSNSTGTLLPSNLTAQEVEQKIISKEYDFWENLEEGKFAVYSLFKNFKNYTPLNFRKDFFEAYEDLFNIFFDTFLILKNENFVTAVRLDNYGRACILTSLRLVVFQGTSCISIPLQNLESWLPEKSLSSDTVLGRDGKLYTGVPTLKYFVGEKKEVVNFSPESQYVSEPLLNSVLQAKEWLNLNYLERNLISTNRYELNKIFNIKLNEIDRVKTINTQENKSKLKFNKKYYFYIFSLITFLYYFYYYFINTVYYDAELSQLTGQGYELPFEDRLEGFLFGVFFLSFLPFLAGRKFFKRK